MEEPHMKHIICQSCGANQFDERGGYRICRYCGTKHTIFADLSAPAASGIGLDDDVRRLLQKCYDDPAHARKYANLILDIDPDNEEALKFLQRK